MTASERNSVKLRRRSNPAVTLILAAASFGMVATSLTMEGGGSGPWEGLAWGAAAFLGIAASGAIYLLPAVLAFQRRLEMRWVLLVVNVAFGVSVIGWIGCFIWALNSQNCPEPARRVRPA